ncbi:hypothetical protein CDAR_96001 [Caerostris darwini]|uniref:Uncharacterized protein n=1 Tax=Caerostris darwini TaxID=1538125 RepID=A0AAV4URA0_9ARAC|nr:hypothetical protein CDAR_96001 [Caerostris darwini]
MGLVMPSKFVLHFRWKDEKRWGAGRRSKLLHKQFYKLYLAPFNVAITPARHAAQAFEIIPVQNNREPHINPINKQIIFPALSAHGNTS